MCGVAGAFGAGGLGPDRIERTRQLMTLRGPDGFGTHSIEAPGGAVTFLHSRLAIFDLDPRSDQPFRQGHLSLVYNGEIYNFPELRQELESLGERFHTSGDTEVILAAYRRWGPDCVTRFEGMWAFALFDERENRLMLSRDRFGEKPLYTWFVDGVLYFASELRFLAGMAGRKPDVNLQHLRRYLVNGYKSLYKQRDGFLLDVREFPAGCNALMTAPGDPAPAPFWSLSYRPQVVSAEEALEGARAHVIDALRLRLRADVPVALRLSGGIDSNVALGLATGELGHDLTTFSVIEDDERYDETANILRAVRRVGCPHHLIRIPKEGFLDRLRGLVDYFGAPMMTISYYLHALASEAIHDAGFKVSLGGTGADELFTGYYDHYLFWLAEMQDRPDINRLVEGWRETYGRFVRNPFLQDPLRFIDTPEERGHIYLRAEDFAGYLTEDFQEQHAERAFSPAILRNRMLNELREETVPVMLHEDDLSAMAYSVENRAVYLDSRLAEFLFTVPSEHLVQHGLPKYLLRAAGQGMVDDHILDNPRKQGINAPVTSFVDFTDPDVLEDMLADGPLFDILRRDRLAELLQSEITLNSESKFLFSIVSAKLFLETHRDLAV